MRYELKIIFSQGEQWKIEQGLLSSPYFIKEIFYPRQVNNIYFDTVNYSDYISAIQGAEFRKKYRIRWYGELWDKVTAPVLEMKYKRGWEGGKEAFSLPEFSLETLDVGGYFQSLRENFSDYSPEQQAMLGELFGRNPALVNSYQRKYFQTADEKFRFTLDEGMDFYDVHSCLQGRCEMPVSRDPKVLLEVKFDSDLVEEGTVLLNHLGFRLCKNSKYVNGIESVVYHKHPMPF